MSAGLRQAATVARKEFRDVVREKSLVVAFLVQLFLAGFSTLLMAGLTAVHAPETLGSPQGATLAYVGEGGLAAHLEDVGLAVDRVALAAALDGFRSGRYDAVVEEVAVAGVRSVTLLMPDGEVQSTLLVARAQVALLAYEEDLRLANQDRLATPIWAAEVVRQDRPYGFALATLLPILVLTPVFLSGAIAGDALSQESRSRTLLVLRSAPVSPGVLVAGKLLVPVLLVPAQVALWLALFWLNGFPIAHPWAVVGAATVFGVLLTASGTVTAAWVRNEAATQAAYAVVVLVLGALAMMLPRDPLNILALLAAGRADPAAWATLAGSAVGALAAGWAAVAVVRRQIRRDAL